MSPLLITALCWLVITLALFGRHARTLRALWVEPMLARPVVIVESDDWGPGPQSDAGMLCRIAQLLGSISDANGHPAVMTLGVVIGVPDGAAILSDECVRYHRHALGDARYADIVKAMQAGCAAGVFSLQRHGMEHYWPNSLLARAREDEALQRWLADPAARSESLPSELQSRWVDASSLPSRTLSELDITRAVQEESEAFRRIFGAEPVVAVPNTFVWSETVERAWAAAEVRVVVTCGRQYEGRSANGRLLSPAREILNAQHGAGGVIYMVRDVYFEPIRGHKAEQVWQAIDERSALGRPVLIETHRANFIGSAEQSESALQELQRTLQGALESHPDVRFMDTAQLAQDLVTTDSHLLLHSASARVLVYVRRLRATPALSRSLRLSGLSLVLRLTERALGTVKPVASVRRAEC